MFRRGRWAFTAQGSNKIKTKVKPPTFAWAKEHLSPGVARSHDIYMVKGKGAYVFDDSNKKYLDFTAGIGVTNLGHCHPHLVKAVKKQVSTLWHGQTSFCIHDQYALLMKNLSELLPKELNSFLLQNSGQEAVEAAIRIARQATGRQMVVSLQGAYHGRTMGALSVTTSKYSYGKGCRPSMPGVVVVPIPYTSQLNIASDASVAAQVEDCLYKLDCLIHQCSHPSEIAMLIAEPIVGEGGYVPLPKAYFQGLRELCNKHGILLCADEVQCGYGRTGTMFYSTEQLGVTPDILLFAKGVANGLPLSGVVTTKEIGSKLTVGTMGGTYAGNAPACAAANAVIEVFKKDKVLDNVNKLGAFAMRSLVRFAEKHKLPIKEIRGRGLMIGIEFHKVPAGTTGKIVQEAMNNGLLICNTSKFETLRLIPPLNIKPAALKRGLKQLEAAILKVVKPEGTATTLAPCCAKACHSGVDGTPCRFSATCAK